MCVAGIMPYSVQGGESSISDFNELKTGGLWSITSETNRPDPLYKYWEVNVTVGKDGTVLQQAKVKAGGNSGIYSRMYRAAEKDWTSWTQQFGYNSLDELATGIGALRSAGFIDKKDLGDYPNTYGYHSGNDFAGPYLSVGIYNSQMQIKAHHSFEYIKVRVLSPSTDLWSEWKTINIS